MFSFSRIHLQNTEYFVWATSQWEHLSKSTITPVLSFSEKYLFRLAFHSRKLQKTR